MFDQSVFVGSVEGDVGVEIFAAVPRHPVGEQPDDECYQRGIESADVRQDGGQSILNGDTSGR